MKKKNKNKKESPDRVTLFDVVPLGFVIYFKVAEYHYFLKATQL